MRILLLPHRFGPSGWGGVETWAAQLARAITGCGHDAAILTRDDSDASPFPPFTLVEEEQDGVRVFRIRHRLSFARSFRETWADDRFRRPVEAALDTFRPDVVHVGHPDGWGVVPLRRAAARGLVTGATVHDYKWICARGQAIGPDGRRCPGPDAGRCVGCVGDQVARSPLRAALASGMSPVLRERLSERIAEHRRDRQERKERGAAERSVFDIHEHRRGVPATQRSWRAADSRRSWEARSRSPWAPAEPAPASRERWRLRQAGLMRELEHAGVVTSPSRFLAGRLRGAGLRREVLVIPNGLDVPAGGGGKDGPTDVGGRCGREARLPLRIGFFGNPLPSKGLDVLARAFGALPPGRAELHLHGPVPEGLASAAQGVFVHGPYPHGRAVALMAMVDVVAIPSTWDENQPMVALEAKAAGRPLLVSDRGGLPELVRDGVDGWVVAAGDPGAWHARLASLVADRGLLREATARVVPGATAAESAAAFLAAWAAAAPRTRAAAGG